MNFEKAFDIMATLADVAVNPDKSQETKTDAQYTAYWFKQLLQQKKDSYRFNTYLHRLQTESMCYRSYEIDMFLHEQGLIQSVNDNVL